MSVNIEKEISFSKSEGITTVTLNRPPLNVLNIEFMRALDKVLQLEEVSAEARVIALSAQGKAFCAGVDVADHTSERMQEMLSVFHALINRIRKLPVPTVALVHGAALGGGFELACACDFVLASGRAKFAVPEITLGVFPPVAMVDLPKAIGQRKAAELIFTGRTLSAAEAERIGLVNAVYPPEEFDAQAAEFLKKFSKLSRSSLAQTKSAFQAANACLDPEEALAEMEERYLKSLMATSDAREGIAAFMDKREPVWSHS